MITERVTVRIKQGIHAEIAHLLHQEAGRFSSSVFIQHGEETASLRSIVAVLSLGVEDGTEIDVLADGTDEAAALAAAVAILEQTAHA
ncbi:HPr family phosphocarrier protein [Cryobacterium mannosilyticum]|uniref:HPr family phosphocarrier protein n=1 Tax=Cryobacterium mannosilyticum TaxID=1259190 RepID=A0A4R8W7U9_9MICO|nr:HPr family phosphocarrier protein [Cryobacterium mannosilyticum]TFC02510.1 HPr family phosphocarrier protein [Cryobacterium mannosilyticum]